MKHAQLDNNKLRTEVDHAAQERSKLQDELSEFQTQLSDARAQISQLEAQVKVLEEELAAARIAAAVGGAVGAGGATVAGVQVCLCFVRMTFVSHLHCFTVKFAKKVLS